MFKIILSIIIIYLKIISIYSAGDDDKNEKNAEENKQKGKSPLDQTSLQMDQINFGQLNEAQIPQNSQFLQNLSSKEQWQDEYLKKQALTHMNRRQRHQKRPRESDGQQQQTLGQKKAKGKLPYFLSWEEDFSGFAGPVQPAGPNPTTHILPPHIIQNQKYPPPHPQTNLTGQNTIEEQRQRLLSFFHNKHQQQKIIDFSQNGGVNWQKPQPQQHLMGGGGIDHKIPDQSHSIAGHPIATHSGPENAQFNPDSSGVNELREQNKINAIKKMHFESELSKKEGNLNEIIRKIEKFDNKNVKTRQDIKQREKLEEYKKEMEKSKQNIIEEIKKLS